MEGRGAGLVPNLSGRQAELLDRVCEEGGFAYSRLASLGAAGDLRAAEAAHEMAWEQLHAAPWHAVHPVWRDAYSLSSLHMASFLHCQGNVEEALRFLDMGLIMGGSLLRLDLNSAISFLQRPASRVDGVPTDSSEPATSNDRPEEHDEPAFVHDHVESKCTDVLCPGMYSMVPTPREQPNWSMGNGEIIASRFKPTDFSELPPWSLSCTSIERRCILPLEDFLCEFLLPGKPVVITGAMIHWPAMEKWKNLEYLQQVIGNRTVPVEVGEHYLASGWKQELMTISQLLERIRSSKCAPASTRVYLAQYPLFDQIPQLREDVSVPDYCTISGELLSINAWLGPVGTVTPLHHDPHHNLLAQVVGQKYIRLYSPPFSESLCPYNEPMLINSSQVDLDNPDNGKFPLVKSLPFMDCILEEGEMLYIPPKWWHYVRSLSSSFSVNFWSDAAKDFHE